LMVSFATGFTTGSLWYCSILTPSASGNVVLISNTSASCWGDPSSAGSPSIPIKDLQIEVLGSAYAEGASFDFCITNLKAVTLSPP
jgi:hypothetical protein